MARGLGELLVSLGLNTAEFSRGLTKAERDAQQFAGRVRSAVAEVGKILGGLEIGREIFSATKDIIAEASALSDLAQATGSTVESLSRLTNQAKIAGSDLATVETALLKLSKGMAGTDAESTKTKEALKLLGVTTRDPVQALEEASVSLSKFQDGVNKVGLAAALFGGKDGQVFLKVMQDIANQQDVVSTKTTKQAEDAKALEIAYNSLRVEATKFSNVILSDVVPALTATIKEFQAGIEAAGGFFKAMQLFSTIDLSDPQKEIDKVVARLADLRRQEAASGGFGILSDINLASIQRAIANDLKRLDFLQTILKQRQGSGELPIVKPEAPFIAAAGGKGAKEAKDATDQLIKSLENQLQATLDLSAEEIILTKLYDLQHDGITKVTDAQEKYIRDIARQVQVTADAKKADEDWRKEQEAISRAMDETAKNIAHSIEASKNEARQIQDGNDAIREQIEFLKGGDEAVRKFTDAKLAATIAEKESQLAIEAGLGATKEQLDAMRSVIDVLKQRQQVLKEFDIAKKFAEEAKALQDVKNAISDTFASAFTDFITGAKSAKDAFKSFADSIVQQISRVAAQKIANAIFGGNNAGGPDFFGVLAKWLGGLGGASAGTGIANIGAGGGGGLAFAATGTDFARGGATMVGEHGPEIVSLPRGARVTPITKGGGGITIVQTINVPSGANSATLRQTAKQAFALAAGQMRRG
jgi:hypothetical protein